jgi:hypothetical protein
MTVNSPEDGFSILSISSKAIPGFIIRIILSSALPSLNRLMLPYQIIFWSGMANFGVL